MSLVPFNPGWNDTKKMHLLQYKKIIIRSNKKLFSAALPPLLYTRAILYLYLKDIKGRTIGNDQELIQSNPISNSQNPKESSRKTRTVNRMNSCFPNRW